MEDKMIVFPADPMHVLSSEEEEDFSADVLRSPGGELLDEMALYLQEIRRFPLLTGEQEQKLALRIQHGLVELKHGQPDPQVVEDGKLAQCQLVEANYRLVVSIARRYLSSSRTLTLLDLIQEGNIGLIRCVPNFDPGRGCKFSTYATWWIRQVMIRTLENAGTIRLPSYASLQLRRIRQARWQLRQTLGRDPIINELAVATGLDEARIRELFPVSLPPLSLDQAYRAGGDEEPAMLGSLLADRNAELVEESAVERAQGSEVSALLHSLLTPREYQIVAARYGLDGKSEQTLEEVGRALKVTRERIRQIERGAFAKLRRSGVIRSQYETLFH
jgi:RNA polymerase primary sigma factor